MPAISYLAIILLSSLILVKAVSWFINSTSKISHCLGISSYTISFLLVAIATSLPEMVVGITSAVEGRPILSYANVLGSNIALFTLVVAIAGILSKGIHTRKVINSRDIYLSTLFAILAVTLAFDGKITRLEGGLLLCGYVVYNLLFLKASKGVERYLYKIKCENIGKEIVIFIVSLLLLVFSSEGIVQNAIKLSSALEVDLGFIGLTLTAIGTSLPEIAFCVGLVKQREQNEILGNIIGSVTANSTAVIGITALITPIIIQNGSITVTTFGFSVFTALLFLGFSKSRKKLSTFEAVILLFIYFAFVATEYYIQKPF